MGSYSKAGLAHGRSRFDEGVENLVAVPLALLLSTVTCASALGRSVAALIGMPFHELGHAAASWLSSRIAIPLPFFTFWFEEQSVLMGTIVAAALGWMMFHTYREQNRFMLGASALMLAAWALITFGVSAERTRMWQILAGAWAEIAFGAFVLIAFFFPLPDRFRWDFWRWVALMPASLTLVHSTMLWRTVSADVSQMPWGSVVGSDGDGDMNRLVQQFGWNANDLADFYLSSAYLALVAVAVTCGYAMHRHQKRRAEVLRDR